MSPLSPAILDAKSYQAVGVYIFYDLRALMAWHAEPAAFEHGLWGDMVYPEECPGKSSGFGIRS